MSEADELFAEAYRLSVVKEKHRQAIDICRQALTIDPNNWRVLIFLGMLLSDHGTAEEKEEARKYFMDAIALAKDNAELCDNWFEESALYHLAIWEWNHENLLAACLLFLADVLTCHSKASHGYLLKLLEELTPDTSSNIKLVLEKIAALEPER
jgi:tetratricopeptide (TPR) repeat protein